MSNDVLNSNDSRKKFIMPVKQIAALHKQLLTVAEINSSLTYSVVYVTYMLSYVSTESVSRLDEYASGIINYKNGGVNKLSFLKGDFHSFSKTDNGALWLLPKSTIAVLIKQGIASHIEVYVKFDENQNTSISPWYVLEFFYKVVSTDDKLRMA